MLAKTLKDSVVTLGEVRCCNGAQAKSWPELVLPFGEEQIGMCSGLSLICFDWQRKKTSYRYSSPCMSLRFTGCGFSWRDDVSLRTCAKRDSVPFLFAVLLLQPEPPTPLPLIRVTAVTVVAALRGLADPPAVAHCCLTGLQLSAAGLLLCPGGTSHCHCLLWYTPPDAADMVRQLLLPAQRDWQGPASVPDY